MQPASDPTRTENPIASEEFPLPDVGVLVDQRYRIVRSLAAGGMGAVFEAEVVSVGRRCALKFLRREFAVRARSSARFEREAQLLGQLEHEHLTAVLDYGLYLGKSPFLVMEYLEGRTLKSLLEEHGRLPLWRAFAILVQLARGMAYVHAQKIVHRDLKPENLMLLKHSDGHDWLKILDFGIARDLKDASGQITRSGAELGTAHYMSPEQARGAKALAPSSDVYAIGAIAYELLTGKRVHTGDSYNEVIYQLLTRPHRPLLELMPECPSGLAALIERCLEKKPGRRPPDAAAVAQELVASHVTDSARWATSSRRGRPDSMRGGRWGIGVAALLMAAALGMRVGAARSSATRGRPSATLGDLAFCRPAPSPEVVASNSESSALATALPDLNAASAPLEPKSASHPEPEAAPVLGQSPAAATDSLTRNTISRALHAHHERSSASVPEDAAPRAPSSSEEFPFVTTNPYGEP